MALNSPHIRATAVVASSVLLSLMGGAASAAENWFVVYGHEIYVFIDAERIQTMADGSIEAWVTMVNEGGRAQREGYKYSLELAEYDCSGKRMSTFQAVQYHADGDVVKSEKAASPTYELVVPDSLGESELKFACGGRISDPGNYTLLNNNITPIEFADRLYRLQNPALQGQPYHRHAPG